MKRIVLLIAFSFSLFCQAQINRCGFEALMENERNAHSSIVHKEKEFQQLLYNQAIHNNVFGKAQSVVRNIPIVVHIIHDNGPENMSDSAVIAGIDKLNLQM